MSSSGSGVRSGNDLETSSGTGPRHGAWIENNAVVGTEEGQGKTIINGYTAHGFKINSHVVRGSVMCFDDQFVSWFVSS